MKKRILFHKAETTVALMIGATLVSKVLGMLRQMMTASIFAASMEGIAFSAASGIPLAIFDMLFSAAVLGSFLPIYKSYLDTDENRARSFSSSFLTVIFLLTTLSAILGMVFARPILRLAAPDLDENTVALAVVLLRIMFPGMILTGVTYILVGIFQSHERFLLPACISAVSNLLVLLYLICCEKSGFGASAVGLSVFCLFSWVSQFLTLAVPLWRERAFPRMSARLKTPDTVLAMKRAVPVMLGSWLIPMTTLIAKAFSSFVEIDAPGATAYAGAAIVVYENAFSVFSIAAGLMTYGICNYLFPKMASRFSSGCAEAFSRLIRKGFFAAMALILPVASALFLLSEEIVGVLYLRGNFTAELAMATAMSLRVLSLAIPAYATTEFFSRVCYSCARVRFPMMASAVGIAVSLLTNIFFWQRGGISVTTVAMSVVLGQTAAGAITLLSCLRYVRNAHGGEWRKYALLSVGFCICAIAMWLCRDLLRQNLHFFNTFQNFLIVTIVFSVGFVVYSIWWILLKKIRAFDLRAVVGVGDM